MGSATPSSTTPMAAPGLWAWSSSLMFTFFVDSRRDSDTAGGPQRSIWCSFYRCYWLLTELPLFSRLKGAVAGWISMLIDPNGCAKKWRERRFEQLRSKLHELDSIRVGKFCEEKFVPKHHWWADDGLFSLLMPAYTVEPRLQ